MAKAARVTAAEADAPTNLAKNLSGEFITAAEPFSAASLRRRQPLIIADFMRPLPNQNQAKVGMQNQIAQNLFNWLQPALLRAFEKPPTFRVWDDEAADTLPTSRIYQHHDIDPSTVGWVRMFCASPKAEDLHVLSQELADALVIGFELSPFQCSLFNRLGVPYVSLAIHPLRFMSDYKFMLSSNFVYLETLGSLSISTDNIHFAAQLKRAKLTQQSLDLESNSAVLFGQVEVDAALIGPRGIISLQNHAQKVRELCEDFEKVYFKPHPYGANAGDQMRFLRQFNNVEFVAHNPYALLASDRIDTVAALTSSVLTEASYFGKKVRPLSSLWVNRADEPAFGIEILSPQFWTALLSSSEAGPKAISELPRGLSDVTVKSLLKVEWETHGAPDVPISGVPVQLGRPMCFGRGQIADSFCRGGGWKPTSGDHRWAGVRGAFLSFRLPPGSNLTFVGNLTVSAMANKEHPVLLQLVCQDHILGEETLTVTSQRDIRFVIPARLLSALGDVEIELCASHAYAPRSIVKSHDLRALSVAVRSIKIEPVKKALPLSLGETVFARDLMADAPFMPNGWHHPEPDGVWTSGTQSRLNVTISPVPDCDMVLRLGNARAFLSELLPSNTVLIRINGHVEATQKFSRHQAGDLEVGGTDITVPISRAALCGDDEVITIDLEAVASHSPALAGFSADQRSLVIMIESFKLEPAIRAAASQPPEHIANIFGPFNIHTGLGVMARNSFLALEEAVASTLDKLDSPRMLGPRAINFNNSLHQDQDTGYVQHVETSSDVNIFSGDVTRVARMVSGLGNDILRDRYNICYGAWELETLPTYLADLQYIDEYWALSTFIADAAQKRMDIPVHAFPISVNLHFPENLAPRERFGIPDNNFTFLFAFSVDSTLSRKNPEAVLDAFQIAFSDPNEPVTLVIKSMIRQASPDNRLSFEAFKAKASKDPRVILIEETLNQDDNASLYMRCDAYVSLHRAEGFGLTMAEAMGYGKPTIGTGYSGNLDFMNEGNSCLVRFEKVEMDSSAYHNQQREWAEPDSYDAAQHMRRVFNDVLFREKIARAGKRTIYEEFSPIAVGRKILSRLQKIHEERS